MTKPYITIDKSYLFGSSKADLQLLFNRYEVVMTEALYYELVTAEPKHRARCFYRLPETDNPVVLIPNVGAILRWEALNQEPLENLGKIARREIFRFNPSLIKLEYVLEKEPLCILEKWRSDVADRVRQLTDQARTITEALPELADFYPGQNARQIEEVKRRICTEREFVGSFYFNDEIQAPSFEKINEEWAIYRWLQIRVLAALDYFKKHGVMSNFGEAKFIENEYLDLEFGHARSHIGGPFFSGMQGW